MKRAFFPALAFQCFLKFFLITIGETLSSHIKEVQEKQRVNMVGSYTVKTELFHSPYEI